MDGMALARSWRRDPGLNCSFSDSSGDQRLRLGFLLIPADAELAAAGAREGQVGPDLTRLLVPDRRARHGEILRPAHLVQHRFHLTARPFDGELAAAQAQPAIAGTAPSPFDRIAGGLGSG